MINNVFSDATGSTLITIRNIIEKTNKNHFPLEDLMEKALKRPLTINDDQANDILSLKYGDSRIIPIFAELTHSTSCATDQVDHIWPKSILLSKKKVKKIYPMVTDEELRQFKEKCNNFVNLQVLDQVQNNQKADISYDVWVKATYPDLRDLINYKKCILFPIQFLQN